MFTNLAHHIDVELLREAFRLIRKDGAPGVDGQTAAEYAKDLESNLEDLHERLKSLRYQATPARRAWIPKEDGRQRPIAILILEDKLVQKAVAMLLGTVYERDFYSFSYGFRPNLGAHDALSALREKIMALGGVWLVDADIRGFFDRVNRPKLREILKRRVNDGGILRLIGKWLRVGILEGDEIHHPETGVPQGGSISPILANIYLHTVLDEWFAEMIQPRLKGRSFLIRFADDFVIGCEYEEDARRVLAVLPKRLARYGLDLHPDKTRLVGFRKPAARSRTARKRLHRAIKSISQWCRGNRHMPLIEQYRKLCQKLQGHYGYYGITGNYRLMELYYNHVRDVWRKWLSRRSGKSHISWEKFVNQLEKGYPLPRPRIVHANV